jgi:hypothetical protein
MMQRAGYRAEFRMRNVIKWIFPIRDGYAFWNSHVDVGGILSDRDLFDQKRQQIRWNHGCRCVDGLFDDDVYHRVMTS